jgi:ligand-binding sensor domain-containing protein
MSTHRLRALFYIPALTALFLPALFGSGLTLALDNRKAISQYHLDVWQTKDGLPQNSVNTIVQTRDGYLWLGTQEGLVRFDGVRFTVFDRTNTRELKSSFIWSLFEDREGNLWIGTNGGGLSRFKDGRFTYSEGLSHHSVRSLFEDRAGNLWMGTMGGGLNRLRDGKFTTYTTKDGLPNDVRAARSSEGPGVGLPRPAGGA